MSHTTAPDPASAARPTPPGRGDLPGLPGLPGRTAAEPGRTRLGRLSLTFTLGNSALIMLWISVGSFLIPMQVTAIKGHPDPDALKNAVAVGAALAAIGNPVFGQISDRTRSRFGRRAPWLAVCVLLGGAALAWQAQATSIAALAISWACVQFILNGFQAALASTMPDRVPPARYGTMSALVGLATPIAILAAAVVIGGIDGHKLGYDGVIGGFDGRFQGEKGYYLVIGVIVAATALFLFLTPDTSSKDMAVEPFALRKFLANFWVDPRKHPDFAIAFVSRFGVVAGYFVVSTYNLYILMEYVKVEPRNAAATMGFLMVVNAVAMVAAALVIGLVADKVGRVKPFVLASGILMALSLFIPQMSPSVDGMTVFNVVNGAAFGMYTAVDMALITKVLPRGEDAGKDLGIINIANAAPQVAAPFIASAIVGSWGYGALFPVCAGIALVGSVLVVGVRSVR
ncbi:MFS transporter [Yinghuangia aomiensis]|uniref:MFS transporter n=1 Tax=Yinghuangia aomiensis TaxID=676205 RepID=A0ABP9HXR0_9ACTN